ncbi:MAG: MarR family transcriptional regulator [Arenicellales bacterium]|nr:MarR family transcriptional regulator [Arenicellales bacterium]MDP7523482.1 MarR family transcriptional regulator [Arenicellales bacterium]
MSNKKQPNRQSFNDLWGRPGFLIRRLHQIHVGMFLEECTEFNVTPAQFAVLTVLYYQGTLDQISIASQIGFDRNTVADVIRRLEHRGLLDRPANISDKRPKLARITDEGREFVDAVQPAMIKAQRRLVSPLSAEEYETLMKLMDKLLLENNEASRAPLRTKSKRSSRYEAAKTTTD